MGADADASDMDYFDYHLDESQIAQTPAEPRDSARLLVDHGGVISHKHVSDLVDHVGAGDVVVVNDTKVLPARLHLTKPTGGKAEVLLLEPDPRPDSPWGWWALVGSGRKVQPDTVLSTDDGPMVRVGHQDRSGRRRVELLSEDVMDRIGIIPLPPYIHHQPDDNERYQTVYARTPGSAAAPTAGLHLTKPLLARIEQNGAEVVAIELKVGLGTFRPVTTQRVTDHHMHSERYQVDPKVWETIAGADRVLAVGTTVVRTLESVAASEELSGSTDLFIHRGFDWKVVDRLLTNFHVPRSSLLVLLDAFIGERWQHLYQQAKASDYRFFSFGDAMLVERL